MERAFWSLALTFLLTPLAGAVAVNADGTLPADESTGEPNPLSAQGKQTSLSFLGGAEHGIDANTSLVIGTGKNSIRIGFQDPNAAPAPALPKAEVSEAKSVKFGVAIILALFAITLFMRDKKALPPQVAPNLGEAPFTIVKPLGGGGMGMVYEAIDRNLDRRVAVKRLHDETQDDPDQNRQLLAEAKTVAALHHPNIVDIHAIVSQGGQNYIVFELIEGKTVQDLLLEHRRLDLRNTRAILDPVCRALEFAHEHGVVHRDLKPANVMITNLNQIKVMDFGISRRMINSVDLAKPAVKTGNYQMTNALSGTLPYLAPEAWAGIIRVEGDVYALGVMAYLMLSGDYPFPLDAEAEAKMTRSYKPLSQLITGLPAGLDSLIDAALEPDADKRLHTPKEFRERLAALV